MLDEGEHTGHGWTLGTMYHHFTAILNEKEKRYTQRFEAQEKALAEAKSNKSIIWAYLVGAVGFVIAIVEIFQRFGLR